jgi:CHAD domain-containing protein
MADSKWIDGLTPTMPVVDAARIVLGERLAAVGRRLYWALNQTEEDTDHVHQLRVSTRRAGAALKIFADCLPPKMLKRARRQLRELRRAAGKARDWDVFLADLTARLTHVSAGQRPGLHFLLGLGHGQRIAAQEHLVQATQNAEVELSRLQEDTLAALIPHAHGVVHLADLSQTTLAKLLTELVDAASQNLLDYERLHEVRILGKQLRYAMEVFVSCYHEDFRGKIYADVEHMQEMLGQANDSHVAAQQLDALRTRLLKTQRREWKVSAPGIEALIRFHQRRLARQRRRFLKWWKPWPISGAGADLRRIVGIRGGASGLS